MRPWQSASPATQNGGVWSPRPTKCNMWCVGAGLSCPPSYPPIGALPRNRLASSTTGGASPISPPAGDRKGRPYGWKQELRWERDDAHIVLYEIIGHPARVSFRFNQIQWAFLRRPPGSFPAGPSDPRRSPASCFRPGAGLPGGTWLSSAHRFSRRTAHAPG